MFDWLIDKCRRKAKGSGRLVMTLLVKNEEMMLETCLHFHRAMGVDAFVVTDNNSTDRTPEIIEKYRSLGWIEHVINETGTDYSQKKWVDRMVRIARKQMRAEWIINADADEMWYSPSGDLHNELRLCGGNIAHCQTRSMYPEEGLPFSQWTWRVEFIERQQDYGLSPYSIFQRQRGKVAHTAHGYLHICMGNHKVRMLIPRKRECDILIYHYNVKGREAFIQKMVNGGKQMEQHRRKSHAIHWRYFYEIYKNGQLSEEYDRVVGSSIREKLVRDGYLVEDTTMRDFYQRLNSQ